MPIRCQVVTQDKLLYEGPADMVLAPGTEGELGILPNHAPLLTTLDYGFLVIRNQGAEQIFTIAGGLLEVRPDVVTVLADVGERLEEIDESRAQDAKRKAEELLKKGIPADPDQYLAIEAALKRSSLRLDAVRRYRKSSQAKPYSGKQGES